MTDELKLETVYDVMEWALQQLGVDGLCNDGCVCDSPECCDIPAGCLLATTRRCVPKESDHHCSICESNDSTGENGVCYVPTPVKVPKKPAWSTEPPTEPGCYLVFGAYRSRDAEYDVAKVFDSNTGLMILFVREMSSNVLSEFAGKRSGLRWLKIDPPNNER